MRPKKNVFTLIMMLFPLLLCTSCKGGDENKVSESISDSTNITKDEQTVNIDEVSEEETENITNEQFVTEQQTIVNKKATSSPSYGGKETLYISTYGANGKVWGHVTMNGKTGRGTIHDDDENSYSITVTRHGGELFGTDQNGRQYVFQL